MPQPKGALSQFAVIQSDAECSNSAHAVSSGSFYSEAGLSCVTGESFPDRRQNPGKSGQMVINLESSCTDTFQEAFPRHRNHDACQPFIICTVIRVRRFPVSLQIPQQLHGMEEKRAVSSTVKKPHLSIACHDRYTCITKQGKRRSHVVSPVHARISLQTLYPLRRFFRYLPYPIMVSLYEKLRNTVYY